MAIRREAERTSEQQSMLEAIRDARAQPDSLADDRVCRRIGDLLIVLDALRYRNAVTTNWREWSLFGHALNLGVIVFRSNPEETLPPPFGKVT